MTSTKLTRAATHECKLLLENAQRHIRPKFIHSDLINRHCF